MADLGSFWRRLDGNMAKGALAIIAIIIIVSVVVWAASRLIGFDENGILAQTFQAVAHSPWAIPVVVLTFTLGSFVGAPQFVMIALAVAAFGPLKGFLLSYGATLVSATVNFQMARQLGARWLRERGYQTFDKVSDMVGRNGFMTAMLVRIVPSAPFVVVNAGMGLTHTPYAHFIAGTALGVVPKTAVIALLGKVVERARSGDTAAIAYLTAAILLWLVLALFARHVIQRRRTRQA